MKMKKMLALGFIVLVILISLAGCSAPTEQSARTDMEIIDIVALGCSARRNIAVYDRAMIGANSATHTNNNFIITLNSDKRVYNATDIISVWGTLEYVGENDTIQIWHGCPFIHFVITDGDNFNTGGASRSVLASSVLQRGRVYHFDHQKSGGWDVDAPDADFWENFFREEDLILPVGEYTITMFGDFWLTDRVPDSPSGLVAEFKITVIE